MVFKMSFLGYVLLLTAALCCTAAPSADGSCKSPDRLDEAALVGDWDKDSYPPGTPATYQCRPGYIRQGTIKKACIGGVWEDFGKQGSCKKRSCGHPGDIPFGSFELTKEETFVFGALVTYACDEGYRFASREKTRLCTATGWSNHLPHCEVMNCPPIEASDNLNVISTSYDEEYSVGQVVKFECKVQNLKLSGASEIFCTSEGRWNADPPTCTEIKCNRPKMDNGKVNNPGKEVFSNNEMIQYTCIEGYRPNKNGDSTCTKDDWYPEPSCTQITCNSPQVQKGSVDSKKAVYKYGDEIDVTCDDGFVLQTEPNKRRKCTINGWVPAPTCVSKKCDRPDIKNGGPYYSYSFPKSPGSYIDYRCNQNYLSHQKEYWGRLLCTNFGWNPEPKCKRQCSYWKARVENAEVSNRQSIYMEGEEVTFTCNSPFRTPDGKSSGIITCLPDGEFTTAKCSVTCRAPQLPNGEYIKSKSEYANNEYLQYKCNKGYMTEKHNLLAATQCVNGKWSENPNCIAITCDHDYTTYKDKTVMPYTCPRGERPASDLVQCFNYGWGPPTLCQDIECTIPATLNLILSPHRISYWSNDKASFSCDKGFNRVGSGSSTCTENGWNPPLPSCQSEKPGQPDITVPSPDGDDKGVESNIDSDSVAPTPGKGEKQRCARAHNPRNSEIKDLKETYYSNDEVNITCLRGYKMYGSATIRCIEGKWEQPPECYRAVGCKSPPSLTNGYLSQDSIQKEYVTDDVVKYKCEPGFHIIGSGEINCVGGQWSGSPECTEDSCEKTPEVLNAAVKEEKIYHHGESAEFTCDKNYGFFGGDSAQCVKGKWMNTPTCFLTSCNPPSAVPNSKINGKPKNIYASGDKVTYSCNNGYSFEKSITGEAICENREWINLPVCRRIGEQCGTPPTVQFGDTTGIRKLSYKSGESVEYKCPNYYTVKGDNIVKCQNGVWGEAPVCLEPCTAKERSMEENNIQLKWVGDKKLYSPHGGVTEFTCKSGYEALPNTQMRIICEHGKLDYPKCFRSGFCVLQQSEMLANNVNYNESRVAENGETITFQCNEEMMADKSLKATCTRGKIQYPKCTAASSCKAPEIRNGFLKTPKDSYDLGSYAEFECNENYVKNIPTGPKCEKGQWTDQPLCYSPCKVSPEDLNDSNVQLVESETDTDKSYAHGAELEVSCKSKFRRPNQQTFFIDCYDGKFKYLRCFSGMTCRITQEGLDGNKLQLDEVHNNDVFYKVGETIKFKCQKGFSHRDRQPTGTCTADEIIYPKCTAGSSV